MLLLSTLALAGDFAEPADAYVGLLRESYAYVERSDFDVDAQLRHTRERAAAAADEEAFRLELYRGSLAFTDPHLLIGPLRDVDPNVVPTSSDLRVARRDGTFVVLDVRAGSPADLAGVRPGWKVLTVGGEAVEAAVQALWAGAVLAGTAAQWDYAATLVVNGRRTGDRELRFGTPKGKKKLVLGNPRDFASTVRERPPVEVARDGDLAVVRLNNQLGDRATIAAVDAATTGRPPRDVYVKAVSLDDRIRDQIYEDPDDDGPIRVWADLLLQAEDPMGTFVTLQLEAERRPLLTKEKALLRKLLEAHRTTLLGPLAPVVDPATAVFRRGILHAAHVRFPTPALRDQLREHPWWRSVRQIVTDPPHLRSGALPNVRRIGMRLVEVPGTETGSLPGELVQHDGQAASWTLLAALAKSRTPLPIEAFCVVVPDTFGDDQLAVLDDLSGLPALRELHLVGGNAWRRPSCPPRPLLSHPAVRALPRLVLDRYPGGHVHKTWETLGRKGREVVLLDPSFSMTIREGATGLDVHVTTTLDMPGVSNHLKQVVGSATGLGKVVVDGPTWAGRDVDRAAEMLAGAAELELPKRKRGT
ncbi:MAG: hypothetical protein KC656_12035 [Myxococcales bacterium]|nr:hypothetical protein [Myxococcales bacterium]